MRGWKKIFYANRTDKKVEVEILILDKIPFKTRSITKNKEGHHMTVKGSSIQEDSTLVNIYASNTGTPKYIKQTLTDFKGETDNNTILVGDFNIPLTSVDRSIFYFKYFCSPH